MSEHEAQAFMRTSAGRPMLIRAFRGRAAGLKTPEGIVSFREVKDAFRTGAWLYDPVMRVFCLGAIGLLLLAFGGFGFFVVTAPPAAKLICGGALLYALIRTARGFWKA
jgi:hypothetical protein